MPGTPTPNNSTSTGDHAPSVSAALCITLAVLVLIGGCVAHQTNSLSRLRETAIQTHRRLTGRGLDDETINQIPIVKYHAAAKRDGTTDSGRGRDEQQQQQQQPSEPAAAAAGRLETIPEDGSAAVATAAIEPTKQHQEGWRRLTATLQRCRDDISKLPLSRFKKSKSQPDALQSQSCSICTDDFIDGMDVRKLPCGHTYHPQCIDEWLRDFGVTCPLCRIDLSVSATVAALPAPRLSTPAALYYDRRGSRI
ncbi:hypothetical protein BX600DRAFT_116417 [Xylariales sp. PMI_506]|nr:hypothetical protein BX600DRAFT_116417 [Xylariales sp. PMI_506]